MSGLPTPPLDDHKSHSVRKSSSKQSKSSSSLSRNSKRSTPIHEHGAVIMDGRHKRVWKACERCRMKKTKCDGESPCKRCKDDGLVCTAGSRKKTEFKQLPRGYAEVLENTQYALLATVQKLYTMVRNNESWELGEPEMNERGQPVIHDIASRLGCIRPSPDLPYAFPEGSEDFAELQAQLRVARSDSHSEYSESRKVSDEASNNSPALDRTERASSSESDHSEYNQTWAQQQHPATSTDTRPAVSTNIPKPTPLNIARASLRQDSPYTARSPFDANCSMPSPIYTDYPTESPMFRNDSPFSPWAAGDDFLTPPSALEYMRQQQYQNLPRSSPMNGSMKAQTLGVSSNAMKVMQFDSMNFAQGTIRPNMLDCNIRYDISEPMDNTAFTGDYDSQMGMA